eukprot:scaffold75650_cov50-Phaeocystis_antarctica.AAC.1
MRVPYCLVTRRSSSRSPSTGSGDRPSNTPRPHGEREPAHTIAVRVRVATPCDEAAKRGAGRPTCRGVEVSS